MKKNLIFPSVIASHAIIFFLSLSAPATFAAEPGNFKISGQVRIDHKTTKLKKADGSTTESSGFGLNRGRVVFEGKLDKDISYRMKMYLDRAHLQDNATQTQGNDGVSRGLVEAKLVHRLSEMFAIELGRHEVSTMSVEGAYSSMDAYSASEMLLTKKPGSANGIVGVTNIANQVITVQLVNSPGYATSAAGDYKVENDDLTATLTWTGNLLEGMVRPQCSFASITRRNYDFASGVKSTPYTAQLAGIGSSVIIDHLTLEGEVDLYSIPAYRKDKTIDATSGKDDMTSAIASVRYRIMPVNVTTILKYSADSEKFTDDAVKDKITTGRMNSALEWRPNENSFRYHASFESMSGVTSKAGAADSKVTSTTLLVGAAASI